ncbi:MAG: NUDIX domain-containing protein [Nanoarchaeota archaeon]
MIEFKDLNGNVVESKVEKLSFRPAVYGLVKKDKKYLVIKPCWDEKFSFVGGGLDCGEDFIEAIKREFLEEIGYEIKVLSDVPIFVNTSIYADPKKDKYFQRLNFYFEVELVKENKSVLDKEVDKQIWLDELKSEDFTYFQQEFVNEVIKNG